MCVRFRNFEQLHRCLKDMRYYSLNLPPKRFLSSSLDNNFVRERCILLDKYLKVSSLHLFDNLACLGSKYKIEVVGLTNNSISSGWVVFVERARCANVSEFTKFGICSSHFSYYCFSFPKVQLSNDSLSFTWQDLLAIPSVAELHEVWDFLSVNSEVSNFSQSLFVTEFG